MTTQLGPYKQGEIPEDLEVQFEDNDGNVIPLNADFQAVFVIKIGSEPAEERTAQVDLVNNRAKYQWQSADMAEPAACQGQMWVGDGTHRLSSDDYEWDVEPSIDEIVPAI